MTDLVVKLKPRAFKELIPIVALYRPGPLGSGMVDDYINRKNGLTRVEYLLPELEELTAETLGVIVYQDQVLQIANRLAGYSLGEADLLRRAMGKKKPEEMAKQQRPLRARRGRARDRQEEGRAGVRADGRVRGLRLREVALDRVRADHLPDRLSQGEPPARVHGRAAHDRGGQPRQARALHRARAAARDRHPRAVGERVGARLHGRARGRALRPRGREERRRGRDRGDPRGARGRAVPQPVRLRVADRRPAREPARGGEPGQVRRVRRAARRARRGVGLARRRARGGRRRAARPRDRPGEPVRRRRRRRARARAGRRGAVDRPAAPRAREGGARLLRHGPPAVGRRRRSSRASPTRARATPRAAPAATCARAVSSPRCARRARGADR